jgi:cytochrome P450
VTIPSTDIDYFDDAVLADPYPFYEGLRELGPVVWMSRYDTYIVTSWEHARTALREPDSFTSSKGVFMNAETNAMLGGNIMLCTDGENHTRLRRVMAAPLHPRQVREVQPHLNEEAVAVVDRLVTEGSFDVIADLSHHLPVSVVSNLLGLPEDGRERMLEWANAAFETGGPPNERCLANQPVIAELVEYVNNHCVPGKLKEGGWAEAIWAAVDEGKLEPHEPFGLMNDYIGPSLDTTINGTGNLIWLFTRHPEQWDRLRSNPELLSNAIEEGLRMETPIQYFTRFADKDTVLVDVEIPAGSRVMINFGCANRDPLQYPDPQQFDIGRSNASTHLALGEGTHQCPGGPLARVEITEVMTQLLASVERWNVISEERLISNALRGLRQLRVSIDRVETLSP